MSVMPGPGVRNVIKNVFHVNLHQDPIRVSVEEDSNAKNDALVAFAGSIFQTDWGGGVSTFERPPQTIGQWND
jgi:hypothetical protein